MRSETLRHKYDQALERLIGEVRHDRSILAAILCGSLSHDIVWEKSDIDLVLVTVDDKKVDSSTVALYSDGVNVHAWLTPRTAFRRMVEGSIRNSFTHSFLTKGRLLYSHDPTIADLCASLPQLGERDRQVQLLRAGTQALPPIDKAHKWLVTRGDLDYAALWILYAATPLAHVEVVAAGRLADREVIPMALELNPAFFNRIYSDLINSRKTKAGVGAALEAVDAYVAERAPALFGAVIDYLDEAREPRSCTEIEDYFARNVGVADVMTACEYLSDQGLIGKASAPVRLTRRSNVEVQELAFFSLRA